MDARVKPAHDEGAPAKKHPRVTDWWNIIQSRPAFARAEFGPFIDS
jgi:hypothetical protein